MTTPKTRREQAEEAAKYKTKPVIKEALQYTGENMDALRAFVPEEFRDNRIHQPLGIKTLEGIMEITEGDWIIKGVKGEFYPCKPDVFEESYELADSTPAPSEVGDEEAANKYWREHRDFHDSDGVDVCQVFKDGAAHARRAQAAEIEELKNDVKRYSEMSLSYMSQLQELRALLERAKPRFKCDRDDGYGGCAFLNGPNLEVLRKANPKANFEKTPLCAGCLWLSDYERMKGKVK